MLKLSFIILFIILHYAVNMTDMHCHKSIPLISKANLSNEQATLGRLTNEKNIICLSKVSTTACKVSGNLSMHYSLILMMVIETVA